MRAWSRFSENCQFLPLIPWLYMWGYYSIRNPFMSIKTYQHSQLSLRMSIMQKLDRKSFMIMKDCKDWPLRDRNWNCIFGGSMSQELGLVSELKTKTTKDWGKEYRSMKSIMYLTHLNSLIYSESLCSFRITIANTDDHCIMKYLCRT